MAHHLHRLDLVVTMHEIILPTVIGYLYLAVKDETLIALRNHDLPTDLATGTKKEQETMQQAIRQIEEYLSGMRRDFTVATRPIGTAFQQDVWQEAQNIPYGRYATYTDIAQRIGRPRAVRAVGQALHKNPLLIIVPCHRIIGKNGIPRGYAGGADLQIALIQHEQQNRSRQEE